MSLTFRRGGRGRPGTTPVTPATGESLTFVNTAGSNTPSDVPIQAMMWFAKGRVPSGSIAVPQIGGVDQTYQADNRTYWPDGSLCGSVFRITRASAAISAGATVQVTFDIRSGSYSNTSAITTADITGASDYKISVSNCHTARTSAIANKQLSIAISGGVISGVKVWHPSNATQTTISVTGAGGTGGQISVSSGTPTIVNAGSGYALTNTTGAFDAEFNSIVSDVAADGNRTGGRRLEQYAKGPACDAWWARTTVSGFPHWHVTIFVERWKKPDGTFLAFRAYAVYGTGLVDTVNAYPNYTYDLDWKDGSTVIKGASTGDTRFETMHNFVGASAATFDLKGKPDWSTDSDAYNAIVPQRTPDECDYFKYTGVILPYQAITPTLTLPATTSGFELNTQSAGNIQICSYQPFGNAGVRSSLGAAGSGNQENPMSELDGLYWMCLRAGDTEMALKWLQNIRASAAHSMSYPQLGAGFFEPTTLYIPNVVPTSAQTFTGMTPARNTISAHPSFINSTGYVHTLIGGGGSFFTEAADTYHQICCTYGAYIVEGEEWQLHALLHSSSTPTFGRNHADTRQSSFGGNTYYGIYAGGATNSRGRAWSTRSTGYANFVMPETLADGSDNVEKQHVEYTLLSQYSYTNDIIPYTGTVLTGTSAFSTTKSIDFTGSGVWPLNYRGFEGTIPFMDDYWFMVNAHLGFLYEGSSVGDEIVAFRDYFKNYYVKLFQHDQPHFMNISYRLRVLDGRPPDAVADSAWSSGGDVSNPRLAGEGRLISGSYATLSFSVGSSTVTVGDGSSGIKFRSTTRIADGSRIIMTDQTLAGAGEGGVTPPTAFDMETWYYWKELTAATGQLCTDAELTIPVEADETISGVYFWVVPANTLPADDSGLGVYEGGSAADPYGRVPIKLHSIMMGKALEMADDANGDCTAAITHLTVMNDAVGHDALLPGAPQYAWDDTRGSLAA